MRYFPVLLTLFLPLSASAQSLPYWQDVNVTSVNAETQRTGVGYFANRADAPPQGLPVTEDH